MRKYCFILLLLVVSCSQNTHRQVKVIPDCEWNKNTALDFVISVDDTISWQTMSISLRNRTDYKYQNLYLFITTRAPYGGVTTDTLNYMLANDDGSWTGKGGMFSKHKELEFLYRKYVRFPEKGNYVVTIRHGMREDNLAGIASLGINVSPAPKE